MISIQREDFSVAQEYELLNQNHADGAIVTFVGKVRDLNLGDQVIGLTLEHYPQMTEKCLAEIVPIKLKPVGRSIAFVLSIVSAICHLAIKLFSSVSAVRIVKQL